MQFTKMNGAGNDFLILDGIREPLDLTQLPQLARTLCDRRFGLGADGLMAVLPAQDADFAMLFYNSDGSQGEMCGNGARCICRHGYESGLSGTTQRVRATAGIVTGTRLNRTHYRIRLPAPSQMQTGLRLTACGRDWDCAYVELGTPGLPHAVVEYPGLADAEDDALRRLGRALRYHPAFPHGANVNFFAQADADHVWERTYERGVEDFTLACGSGTACVAAVLSQTGRIGDHLDAQMPGGHLRIDLSTAPDGGMALDLSGPTMLVAEGTVMPETLAMFCENQE